MALRHGDFEYIFKFNKKEDLDLWQTSSGILYIFSFEID